MRRAQRLNGHSAAKQSIAEGPSTIAQDAGALGKEVPRFVTQARVAHSLAIPEDEIRQISRNAGLGRVERAGTEEVTYFTYDEMCQLGLLAAQNRQARQH
jgi:hypothetical protein